MANKPLDIRKTQFLEEPDGTVRAFRRFREGRLVDANGMVLGPPPPGYWDGWNQMTKEEQRAANRRYVVVWALKEVSRG